jgi:transposase
VDELGPVTAKTYPGEVWQAGPYRATFEPDYGRRGKLWIHGAFEPVTGLATLLLSPKRDGASHLQLLEQMIKAFPAHQWVIIEDNLTIHHSRDVQTALLAWPEIQIQFTPKYAPWLNLIEPWWKQLKALALKGRRFEGQQERMTAFIDALEYWNNNPRPYHWRKVPKPLSVPVLGNYGSSLL